jgi:hypothetical protein
VNSPIPLLRYLAKYSNFFGDPSVLGFPEKPDCPRPKAQDGPKMVKRDKMKTKPYKGHITRT